MDQLYLDSEGLAEATGNVTTSANAMICGADKNTVINGYCAPLESVSDTMDMIWSYMLVVSNMLSSYQSLVVRDMEIVNTSAVNLMDVDHQMAVSIEGLEIAMANTQTA